MKQIKPALNGAERAYSDGEVELYVGGTDYRVRADGTVLVAEYHDDGSIDGWTTCHSLKETLVSRLRERASALRTA